MEIIMDNEERKVVSFRCDCSHPGGVVDVGIYRRGGEVDFSFMEGIWERGRWWPRLKAALFCLLGRKILFAEVIVRREDLPALLGLIREAMFYSNTDGTGNVTPR